MSVGTGNKLLSDRSEISGRITAQDFHAVINFNFILIKTFSHFTHVMMMMRRRKKKPEDLNHQRIKFASQT